jgi:hypothetical protein
VVGEGKSVLSGTAAPAIRQRSNHPVSSTCTSLPYIDGTASGEGQVPEILTVEPKDVKGSVGQVAAATHQIPEADPPLVVDRHYLTVQDKPWQPRAYGPGEHTMAAR